MSPPSGDIPLFGGTNPSQCSVLNTLLYQLAHSPEDMHSALAAWLMLVLAPRGDLPGVSHQVTVLIIMLTDLLMPTSAVLGAAKSWITGKHFILVRMPWLMSVASALVIAAVLTEYIRVASTPSTYTTRRGS